MIMALFLMQSPRMNPSVCSDSQTTKLNFPRFPVTFLNHKHIAALTTQPLSSCVMLEGSDLCATISDRHSPE